MKAYHFALFEAYTKYKIMGCWYMADVMYQLLKTEIEEKRLVISEQE